MSESDLIVRAEGLSKVYRLYAKPHYRFLDMFGLLRRPDAYTEHSALTGVNLQIRRGEKVAFIGRNGAGKSTLLKLITGVVDPTSGTLKVSQGAHALLQIGSGFHPDFTGRQNALAYLAHLGVSGAEAQRQLREIVEFAELEEYIDQPIKTYSSGMVARLMFATSTVIEPELLVLDEILGVGDAYFAQKSFDRIREMCVGGRTTVLLVSHDIYSASRISERMIWLDGGRIIVDGPAGEVMKAYEDSIRVQEESRLMRKAKLKMAAMQSEREAVSCIRVDLRSPANVPMSGALLVAEVALRSTDESAFADLSDEGLGAAAALEGGAAGRWGPWAEIKGVRCRQMKDHGSPLHRVSVLLVTAGKSPTDLLTDRNICIRYLNETDTPIEVIAYGPGFSADLGLLAPSNGRWVSQVLPIVARPASPEAVPVILGRTFVHGTGDVLITGIRALDAAGRETLLVRHGEPMTFEVAFEIRNLSLRGGADMLLGFHRDGVADVCRLFTSELQFDAAAVPCGVVKIDVPRVMFANGVYTVSVTLAKAGYYASNPVIFYSINPDVYACLSRVLEIQVFGGDLVASGAGVVGEAAWRIERTDGARSESWTKV
jgi:ABC-type polysaccharide/polyol phosphate transport system ATPase subunit